VPETPEKKVSGRWTMRQRDLGVTLWIAFLCASVGTVVLFAVVDPLDVQSAWMDHWQVGRKLAYGLGFGFLFVLCLLASWLSIFMVRSGPQRGHASGHGTHPAPEIKDPSSNNPDLDIGDLQ
jgi:hypothetical protein